jgi:PAS domain S-box-containing protein
MKIKNQFRISIIAFALVLVIVASSVIFTEQQTAHLQSKQAIARDIQTRASNLAYISNDYFLYQDNSEPVQWKSQFSMLQSDLLQITPYNPGQQSLIDIVKDDAQQLNAVWTSVVLYLDSEPRNVSIRILPTFQTYWSRISVQNQALSFDAQRLTQSFRNQIDDLNAANIILISVILGLFGAYFLTNYLITYRKTLKSISELQAGVAIVGSGNLDHSVKANEKNEIGELGRSFNQMAANLKSLTTSKTDLEKEIADRKKVEEALQALNERFEMAQRAAGVGVWDWDLKTGHIEWSSEMFKLFGLDSKSVLASFETWNSVLHPQDKEEARAKIGEALKTYSFLDNEYRVVLPSGEIAWINALGKGEYNSQNEPVRMTGICVDITERKKAEHALVSSEKRYRRLFETSQDGIVSRDKDGHMIDCNQAYAKMVGYTKAELKNLSPPELLPEKWRKHRKEVVKDVLEKGGSVIFEREYIRKDGVIFPASVRSWRLTDEKGEIVGVWSVVRDITQQKELQRELEQYNLKLEKLVEDRTKQLKDSERLAAIGATAGMVGHDIRNPLQAMTSDVYLAKSDLELMPEGTAKEDMRESLDGIEKNIDYVNKIVQDLQDYARPLLPTVKETDVKMIFEDILLKGLIPENIEVSSKVEERARIVVADPDFLKRILSNLVNNAVQAMPEGGNLIVKADVKSGEIVITVEDSGVGIPEKNRDKLFAPMFTTKSKGQGFGLAVVKRLTEAIGGTVSFESEVGKGTKFIVYLPSQMKKP